MRLPKNFGISQKSKVKIRTLSENRPKLSRLLFAFNFRESLTDTTESFGNFDICQKCQKYTGILKIDSFG